MFLMRASHCTEIDTSWPYEYGILNFARRLPRTWSTANQQPKQVRSLQKVTRWHPNHARRQHEDVKFYYVVYPQDTRTAYDGYTTSYWEYDAFELGHEGVTWPPDGIKPAANSKKWESEIRQVLPERGGAGPVTVAHHVLWGAWKEAMLLPPFYCCLVIKGCHSAGTELWLILIEALGVTHAFAL